MQSVQQAVSIATNRGREHQKYHKRKLSNLVDSFGTKYIVNVFSIRSKCVCHYMKMTKRLYFSVPIIIVQITNISFIIFREHFFVKNKVRKEKFILR
jgi:hypothetical protein